MIIREAAQKVKKIFRGRFAVRDSIEKRLGQTYFLYLFFKYLIQIGFTDNLLELYPSGWMSNALEREVIHNCG